LFGRRCCCAATALPAAMLPLLMLRCHQVGRHHRQACLLLPCFSWDNYFVRVLFFLDGRTKFSVRVIFQSRSYKFSDD
jgi:hypothetical protein